MGKKTIRPRKRVFFSCEGISERNYAQYIRKIAEDNNLPIYFDCKNVIGGGDPLKIVEDSIKIIQRNIRNHGGYVAKTIMLDSDKLGASKERDSKIPGLIRKHKINLIYSNPNIEGLLLRHFQGYENAIPSVSKSMSELQKVWPEYFKGVDAKTLYRKLGPEGLKRACQVEMNLRDFLISIGFNFLKD